MSGPLSQSEITDVKDSTGMRDGISGKVTRVLALMESNKAVGPARHLIEFASRVNRGNEASISLATFVRGSQSTSPFIEEAEKAGLKVYVLHERRRFDAGVASQLRSVIADCSPDILQSHNVKSHFLVRSLGLNNEFPWIAFNHGYTATDLKDRIYNQFDRWSLRKSFRVVAVCGPFAERLTRQGIPRERVRVRHNSVRNFEPAAPESIRSLKEELGLSGCIVVICIGRLSREKGHDDLLQAIARLRKHRTGIKLRCLVVGDGPELPTLIAKCRDLELESVVSFAGFRRDIGAFYGIADLMVLPSHSEGSPNVVLEAMSAGVPIVATAVGGVPEMIQDGESGILVPPRLPAALSTAIERALSDADLRKRLAAGARLRVMSEYSPESYCRSMLDIYREALDSWPRQPEDGSR